MLTSVAVVTLSALFLFAGGTAAAESPSSHAAMAHTYFVASAGSNRNSGSSTKPWKTVQYAVDRAAAGSTITLLNGHYAPFTVKRPGLTIWGASRGGAVVSGRPGVQSLISIDANDTTIRRLTVSGCVPSSHPPGSFETGGSAGVRINGVSGVTLRKLTIKDSDRTLNQYHLHFGCYGIAAYSARNVLIEHNEINHNGYGVFIYQGGQDVNVIHNFIDHNDVEIRTAPKKVSADGDYGSVGVGFDQTAGRPGPTASHNTLWNNFGPSRDYGTDGGAFEIYGASDVTMSKNVIYNNENIFETGTGRGERCVNNRFLDNSARGKTRGSALSESLGIILRCASHMLISGNRMGPVNYWMFDITSGGTFGGSDAGLTIMHNRINMSPPLGDSVSEATYALTFDPIGLGLKMHIDDNQFRWSHVLAKNWASQRLNLGAWRAQTGFDIHSTTY